MLEKPEPHDLGLSNCILCDRHVNELGRPLTGEHVTPAWVGRLFPDRSWTGTRTLRNRDGFQRIPVQGDHLEAKFKVLCERCNNVWGSDLQVEVSKFLKPILLGGWKQLTNDDRHALATWAATYAVVREYSFADTAVTPLAVRQGLLEGKLSPGLQVWLAPLEEGAESFSSRRFGMHQMYEGDPVPDGIWNSGLTTFGIGRLAFVVFDSSHPDAFNRINWPLPELLLLMRALGFAHAWIPDDPFPADRLPQIKAADLGPLPYKIKELLGKWEWEI